MTSRDRAWRWSQRAPTRVAAVLLGGAFWVLSVVNLRKPGLHFDEVFWANAALGHAEGPFVTARFLGIPIYVQSYSGALKSWMYFPVFKIFGTSTLSVRLPMILLGLVGLWLLFRLVSTLLGRRTAVLVLGLMVLNTSFLFHVRMDFGPVVVEFLFKVLALMCAFQVVRKPTFRTVTVFYLILLLGLFNKLNFIWFINALVTGVALFYWPDVRQQLATLRHRVVGYYWAGYLVCLMYYLMINRLFEVQSFFSLSAMRRNLGLLPGRFGETVSGLGFYENFSAMPLRWSGLYLAVLLAVTALGLLCLFRSADQEPSQRCTLFLGYVVLALLGQIVATQQAGASWHYLMVYPMLAIIMGHAISMSYARIRWRQAQLAYVGAVLIFVAAFQGNVYLAYHRNFDVPENPMWSPTVEELAAYTKSSPSNFVIVDWGIWNQLILADDQPNKYTSLEFFLNGTFSPAEANYFVQAYLTRPGFLFVTHPPPVAAFGTGVARFFAVAADLDLTLQKVKVIGDRNRVLFEVYEVQR